MNTKKIIFIAIGIFIVAIWCLKGCTDKEHSNNFSATRPVVVTYDSDQMEGVMLNMVMDHSKSMIGYLDIKGNEADNINFASTVGKLLSNFEYKFNSKCRIFCGKKEMDKRDFMDEMKDYNYITGNSSEIHEMIGNCIEEYVNDTSVCVIVSDLVMSFGPSVLQQKKDMYYNKNKLDNLSQEIYNAVFKAKKNDFHIMIMQYTSDFNGNYYYTYTENDINTDKYYKNKLMKNRPYYLMLIGKKEHLVAIYDNCAEVPERLYTSFDIEESSESKAIALEVLDKNWQKGEDAKSTPGEFYTENNLNNKQTEVNITYDNFVLPKYIQEKDLRITVSADFKVKDTKYSNNKLSFTLVSPEFDNMKKKTTVAITVSYENLIDWEEITISDDIKKEPDEIEGKTWEIEKIFERIDEVYFEEGRESEHIISKAEIMFVKE